MKKIKDALSNNFTNKNIEDDLKREYNQALKDPNFKKLVDKLKLSDEILMKYTSSLQESVEEILNDAKAKTILDSTNKVRGYIYVPKVVDGELTFVYQASKKYQKFLKETKHLNNIYFYDIPRTIKEASIKDIDSTKEERLEAIEWIMTFIEKYKNNTHQKGLYLHGNFGCGKTYFISALFNELAKDNIKSAVIYWPEFLRELKSSFQTDFNSKFNKLKNAPLLLIDDIGAESVTPWNRDEILGTLLQHRMQEEIPTFFTSNLTLEELEEHLSDTKSKIDQLKAKRIIERIKQLTDNIKMISENLRK